MSDILTHPHYGEDEKIDPIIQWLVDHGETEAADNLRALLAQSRDDTRAIASLNETIEYGQREREHLLSLNNEAHAVISRIWAIFGTPSYEQLAGRSIYDLVREVKDRDEASQAILARIRRVREGYADQAKFADAEPAAYFREFIRRLDGAVNG